MIEARDIANLAAKALDDKQGRDIRVRDVRGVSEVTDWTVVASGGSPPQIKALANEVQHALKEHGVSCYRRAGEAECGWVVLDYFDCIVHIFQPETREYYDIEALWGAAPVVDA
jgi:ribosome-associated protein